MLYITSVTKPIQYLDRSFKMRKYTSFIALIAVMFAFNGLVLANSCGSSSAHKHDADHSKVNAEYSSAKNKMTAKSDIVETAVSSGSFKTLVAAVKAAGLVDALKSEGPFTVFAPTDEAFAKLPEGTVESLLNDKEKLTAILTYHVVEGKVMASDVVKIDKAQTLNGQEVDVKTNDGKVMIDNATVTTADIACSNGVIHVIDEVILPEK